MANCNGLQRRGLLQQGATTPCAPAPAMAYVTITMEAQPHILVVDDDREIRDLLSKFLERQGMRVAAARDAKEARRLWPLGRYHLVVLDLMLPGESGLDFAKWLRTQGEVPIVMLTAMGDETDRIVGLELGADDYLSKPFNPRELLARVRAVLRRASLASRAAATRMPWRSRNFERRSRISRSSSTTRMWGCGSMVIVT